MTYISVHCMYVFCVLVKIYSHLEKLFIYIYINNSTKVKRVEEKEKITKNKRKLCTWMMWKPPYGFRPYYKKSRQVEMLLHVTWKWKITSSLFPVVGDCCDWLTVFYETNLTEREKMWCDVYIVDFYIVAWIRISKS